MSLSIAFLKICGFIFRGASDRGWDATGRVARAAVAARGKRGRSAQTADGVEWRIGSVFSIWGLLVEGMLQLEGGYRVFTHPAGSCRPAGWGWLMPPFGLFGRDVTGEWFGCCTTDVVLGMGRDSIQACETPGYSLPAVDAAGRNRWRCWGWAGILSRYGNVWRFSAVADAAGKGAGGGCRSAWLFR